MEWGRIKTILIWLFSIVNLFLLIMFLDVIYSGTNISDDVIESTVAVLEKNNVIVDKDIVPSTHTTVKICNVENRYNSVLSMLEAAKKTAVQEGSEFYVKDGADVGNNTFLSTINESKTISNPVSYAKKMIKKSGLVNDTGYSVVKKDGYIYFYLEFENKIFYDSYLKVKVTEKGIQEIYGYNWLGDSITDGGPAETVSPLEILVDFATQQKFEKKVTVTGMKAGYYIGSRSETVKVTAFPVWQITLDNGKVFYYDMRNGDLL